MIYATRYHDISMGHRVYGHENKCKHIHGHNYRIHFTVVAPDQDEIGRVIDFGVIKTRLCDWLEKHWDHKTLLWENDILAGSREQTAMILGAVEFMPFNPTAENIAKYLVDIIGPRRLQGTGCVLLSCKVEETAKCSAEYFLDYHRTGMFPTADLDILFKEAAPLDPNIELDYPF